MQSMHCMFKCRYNSSSVQSRQLVIYRVVLCVCVFKYQCYGYCCHLNNTPWPFLSTITPCCPPKALCALSPIQLLFGWLVGPVRLRDVWKCTSMESGEQFVVTVGTHWTAKWSVSSSATREWTEHILRQVNTVLVKVQDSHGWEACFALAVKPTFCSAHIMVLGVDVITLLTLV